MKLDEIFLLAGRKLITKCSEAAETGRPEKFLVSNSLGQTFRVDVVLTELVRCPRCGIAMGKDQIVKHDCPGTG